MMLVGFLGCYGAIQESQCLLGTVSIFNLIPQKVSISFYETWFHVLFADLYFFLSWTLEEQHHLISYPKNSEDLQKTAGRTLTHTYTLLSYDNSITEL